MGALKVCDIKLFYKIAFFAIIISLNAVLNCNPLNLIVTIPQILFVLFLIVKKDIPSAVFYHLLFMMTSFGYVMSSDNISSATVNLQSYNYAKWRIGFVPVFLLQSALIIFVAYNLKYFITKEVKRTDFYILYIFLKYIFISGSILMCFGLVFGGYYIEGVMTYGVYSLFVLMVAYMLAIVYNNKVYDRLFQILPYLLICGILLSFIFKIANLAIVGELVLCYYGCLLIPSFFYGKKILFVIMAFLIYLLDCILNGSGGKTLILVALLFMASFILAYSNYMKFHMPKRVKIVKLLVLIIIISFPSILLYIEYISSFSDKSNFVHKLHSVQTMFGFLFGQNDMTEVDDSPLTRLAQIANIIYEGLLNPVFLIFGRGFGGYYHDYLNLMTNLDLSGGTYTEVQIAKGEYYYAHDAFVSVPFISGLVGSVLWLKCIVNYLKHSYYNYYKLAAIPFLLMIFFFDTQIGAIGVIFLYASESKMVHSSC